MRAPRSRSGSRLSTLDSRLFRGISLTEVLIAMGIMTVGLLGVASVFPVGSWYAQKAVVADTGSAIAQSVMNDLVTRGMLDPGAWSVMTPAPLRAAPNDPNARFATSDGKYAGIAFTDAPGKFVRPFAEALSEGLKANPTDKLVLAKQFGHAYVIDPMFAAAASTNVKNFDGRANAAAYAFPSNACYLYPGSGMGSYYTTAAWKPWRAATGGLPANSDKTWPIRRVTFAMSNGWPLDKSAADNICRGSDDLAYDFPQRDDRPAMQNWDTANVGGAPTAMARKWTGDYSWIASVVPTTNAARDGMARNPEGFAYDVSVVVFHKRQLPPTAPSNQGQLSNAMAYERAVSAAVLSTGLNGGELLLKHPMIGNNSVDTVAASPFDQLKTGQWIMLCGPHPNSSDAEPRFVLNWYQVQAIDKSGDSLPPGYYFDANADRIVTVRGSQWPWQPRLSYSSGQQNSDVAKLSDDLCVGIVRGAVAVHTKTIRLESSQGSSYGTGMSVITPPGVPPGYILR